MNLGGQRKIIFFPIKHYLLEPEPPKQKSNCPETTLLRGSLSRCGEIMPVHRYQACEWNSLRPSRPEKSPANTTMIPHGEKSSSGNIPEFLTY